MVAKTKSLVFTEVKPGFFIQNFQNLLCVYILQVGAMPALRSPNFSGTKDGRSALIRG